jgi:hypothetical protein
VKLINAWPVLTKANQSHHFNSAWRFALNKAVEADAEVASGAMRSSAEAAQSLPGAKLLFGNSPSASDFIKKLHAEDQIRYIAGSIAEFIRGLCFEVVWCVV